MDGGESYEPWEDKRPESDVLMRISAVDGFSVRPSGMLIIVAISRVGAVGEVTVMLGGRDECWNGVGNWSEGREDIRIGGGRARNPSADVGGRRAPSDSRRFRLVVRDTVERGRVEPDSSDSTLMSGSAIGACCGEGGRGICEARRRDGDNEITDEREKASTGVGGRGHVGASVAS